MRTRPVGRRALDIVAAWMPLGPAAGADMHRAPGCAWGLEVRNERRGGRGRSLEGDVVVRRRGARRAAGRSRGEVVGVDGDVRAGAEAVARGAAVVARAREELHRVGDDVNRLA